MRGGSVRLTQAVRLAACGKEPEENLLSGDNKQQTRMIFSSRHRKTDPAREEAEGRTYGPTRKGKGQREEHSSCLI